MAEQVDAVVDEPQLTVESDVAGASSIVNSPAFHAAASDSIIPAADSRDESLPPAVTASHKQQEEQSNEHAEEDADTGVETEPEAQAETLTDIDESEAQSLSSSEPVTSVEPASEATAAPSADSQSAPALAQGATLDAVRVSAQLVEPSAPPAEELDQPAAEPAVALEPVAEAAAAAEAESQTDLAPSEPVADASTGIAADANSASSAPSSTDASSTSAESPAPACVDPPLQPAPPPEVTTAMVALNEVRRTFRRLCVAAHPDRSGPAADEVHFKASLSVLHAVSRNVALLAAGVIPPGALGREDVSSAEVLRDAGAEFARAAEEASEEIAREERTKVELEQAIERASSTPTVLVGATAHLVAAAAAARERRALSRREAEVRFGLELSDEIARAVEALNAVGRERALPSTRTSWRQSLTYAVNTTRNYLYLLNTRKIDPNTPWVDLSPENRGRIAAVLLRMLELDCDADEAARLEEGEASA